jgi:hypothetical protein
VSQDVTRPPVATLFFRALLKPESINVEERTVRAVWTTGSPCLRRNEQTQELYYEVLSLNPAHVRMARFLAELGLPLLDAHDQTTTKSVYGRALSPSLTSGQGDCLLWFSKDEDADRAFQKVIERVLGEVSVGYIPYRMIPMPPGDDGLPMFLVIDWEPTEVSLTPVNFDIGARIRSAPERPVAVIVDQPLESANSAQPTKETRAMPANDQTPGAPAQPPTTTTTPPASTSAPVAEQPKPTGSPEVTRALPTTNTAEVERTRVTDILQMCRTAKLPAEYAEELIRNATPVHEARKLVIDRWAEKDAGSPTRSQHRVEAGDLDETVTRRRGMETAILHRFDPRKFKLDEPAKEFVGLSLVQCGAEALAWKGIRTRGLHPMEIATRSLQTTSDLPYIFASTMNRTLREGYQAQEATFEPFVRRTYNKDFRPVTRVQFSDAPALGPVTEKGEFPRGAFTDGAEGYKLLSNGLIVGITREMVVNDDLGALTRIPNQLGVSAFQLEGDLVYFILNNNPVMADGKTLFHADHGNLLTGLGAPSKEALAGMRAAMRKQKTLQKKPMNLVMRYLIVPEDLETAAEQVCTVAINATKAEDVNVFVGKVKPITEARLGAVSATKYYGSADYNQVDTIELATLEGQEGPKIDQQPNFYSKGIEFSVVHDVAAKAIDYRGLTKVNS